MEPSTQYAISTDDVRIAFWTLGDGAPLLYLTGGPWSHIELWQIPECRRWYERLAQQRMLVRYDVRGTGASDRAVSDYSLDALVRDLEAIVDRLSIPRFTLMAAADAGPVAITYAIRHPDQLSSLVLWCSWARTATIQSPRIMAWIRLIDEDWELMTDACAHIALGWSAGEAGREAARHLRGSVTPDAARAALSAIGEFDVTGLLPRLESPTLVVHRRDIAWIPVEVARELASQIRNARLILLEGETTAPYLGDAETAANVINAFLDEADEDEKARRKAGASGSELDTSRPSHTGVFPDGLTTREVEVLRLLAGGCTNGEIANALFVSVRTVERHVANIYEKIDARGRANATAYALIRGLI